MVYIHFPSNLTEEELMLQAKYGKLKKKKKALQALKAPKQEPEKNLILKRPADARDAREVARKLLKSGAIQAIQKPPSKQETSFKRPKVQERKRSQQESSPGAQFQSFSSVETPPPQPSPTTPDQPTPNLYQQFANERDKEEQITKAGDSPRDKPRSGNTIYVSGNKVTEEFLKKHFCDFGEILNISMEIEKGRGFITFAKTESADRAITEIHSKTVGGIQLQVQLARRQPQINPINDAGSSAAWSALATNRSQKGKHKDNRELVCYDHDDIF
ncbi:negative elongation factor E [Uranotaenia lowii]|uniref:negative elongation factor E n=1 Tax=Uranotaenia lowii TaxID=190385 RepID=UPI002478580D|nr:negative elongation factor E [Uranotaenia lowii]